jgi:hypothetical protein
VEGGVPADEPPFTPETSVPPSSTFLNRSCMDCPPFVMAVPTICRWGHQNK